MIVPCSTPTPFSSSPSRGARLWFWCRRSSLLGAVALFSWATSAGCSGDVQVNIPGCESCPERCLSSDGARGKCVTCLTDNHCQTKTSPTKKCTEKNRCICGSDQDCPEGTHCAGIKGCVECFKDEHCTSPDRPVCALDNSCVFCKPNQTESCLPSTGNACEPGTRTCKASGLWGPCEGAKACTTGQTCEKQTCVEACKNECKEGEKKCVTDDKAVPGKYQTCGRDEQNCLVWKKAETACPTNQVCSNQQCVSYKCPPTPCQINQTRCFDNGNYQKCIRDSKGCPTWSAKLTCPKNTECRNKLNRCTACEPGDKLACYSGDAKTRNKGRCKDGARTCNSAGSGYGACTGQVLPRKEECDGTDDDCDGQTDEGCDCINGKTRNCYNASAGCQPLSNNNYSCTGTCKPGTQTCAKGKWGACKGAVEPAAKEACDGQDDNCDGKVDDGCQCKPGIKQNCGSDVGICKKGSQTCNAQGQWGPCTGGVKPQAVEACNGKDDNCDGKVDESFTDLGDPCTVGQGECKATGKKVCNSSQDGVTCDAKAGTPSTEICDGKDNNCDGNIDESFKAKGLGGTCDVGKGICKAKGTLVCNAAKDDVTCDAKAGTPGAEVCNGKDDDCNGAVDEGTDRDCYTGTPASTAGVGVCQKGKERCVQGQYSGKCDNEVTPSQELCNNQKDDDCDGATDEQDGRALRFSGNYNRVDIAHNNAYALTGSASFTVEMWFNFDKLGTRKIALLLNKHKTGSNYGFHLKIQVDASKTAPQCALVWWNGSTGHQILFGDCLAAQWTHVAMVFDQPNHRLRFYKDGQIIHDQPAPQPFNISYDPQTQHPLVFGSETGVAPQGDPSLRGQIASVRISNNARYTQTGQQRFTPSCTFQADANTVGLWNLDDGGGTTVKDLSSQSNHGTVVGATWTTGRACNKATSGGCTP